MDNEIYVGDLVAEKIKPPRMWLNLVVNFQQAEGNEFDWMTDMLCNKHTDGIALRSESKVDLGWKLLLSVHLPNKAKLSTLKNYMLCTKTDCEKVDVFGQVVWSKPIFGKQFIHGVKFMSVDPKTENMLNDFLTEFILDTPLNVTTPR